MEHKSLIMKIAIEGCLHGQLQQVYRHLNCIQHKLKIKLDALLVCGDFQSLRHQQDLEDMHCPQKYKQIGDFQLYFQGKKKAPVLTILIGGNHQAVNSLRQSFFGGWLAPNIYYLGQTGSILLSKGKHTVRIAGCSGIYKSNDFKYTTRIERYPLKGKDRITAYHVKQVDLLRLELLARISTMQQQQPDLYGHAYTNFDVVLSHDWPKDIAVYGDLQQLLRVKPFLKRQIQQGTLGSAPMLRFLQVAKPNYWFSAHMHVKFPAIYPHPNHTYTHFLALDKCLGHKSCLQLLELKQSKQQEGEQSYLKIMQTQKKHLQTIDVCQRNQTQQFKESKLQQPQGSVAPQIQGKKVLVEIRQVEDRPVAEKQKMIGKEQFLIIEQKVRVQVDPTWIAVLKLTDHYSKGSEQLYYIDKQETKICDISLMNGLIKDYLTIRQTVQQMQPYYFNTNLSQQQQTQHFVSTTGLSQQKLEEVCFEKQRFEQNMKPKREQHIKSNIEQQINDQIELDL